VDVIVAESQRGQNCGSVAGFAPMLSLRRFLEFWCERGKHNASEEEFLRFTHNQSEKHNIKEADGAASYPRKTNQLGQATRHGNTEFNERYSLLGPGNAENEGFWLVSLAA